MARFDPDAHWMTLAMPATVRVDEAVRPRSVIVRRLMRQGSLPWLVSLEAIVRHGSFSRAAEELHWAQPTLSGHVRKLADVLGGPLFERSPGPLTLTPLGQTAHAMAVELLMCLGRAEAALASVAAAGDLDREPAWSDGPDDGSEVEGGSCQGTTRPPRRQRPPRRWMLADRS